MTSLCDRCRAHPPEMVLGDMRLCAPCAEQLAWSHGIQASTAQAAAPAPMPAPPVTHVVAEADPFVGFALRHQTGAPTKETSSSGFPWIRVMFVLGGVATLSAVGLWVYKITENVGETKRAAMRVIEKHPELLKAVI